MKKRIVRPPHWREPVKTDCSGDSLTQQSHAESCDINAIVARFDRTGQLPLATRPAVYMDVTGLQGDLTELYNQSAETIQRAQEFERNYVPPEPPPPPAATPAAEPSTPIAPT